MKTDMENREVIFTKAGNRPDIGHFEAGERKAFTTRVAEELVSGRIAEYAPQAKKDPPAKAGKET